MRILLTEVTGAFGRGLAQSLLAAGHDVSGIADQPHRDLDPGVDFVCARLDQPALHELAAEADVVVQLPALRTGLDGVRPADVVRVVDAAARGGARIVFPSLSLLLPAEWERAEELVASGWAPSLIIRIAPPLGRQGDGLVCRTVASLLAASVSGPARVLHIDDLIRFLGTAVVTDRTGTVELGTHDTTDVASARRILQGATPRLRSRGIGNWSQLAPDLDLAALQDDWHFECGWSAADAVADTVRGLAGRKLGPDGALAVPGRFPVPVGAIAQQIGAELVSAAPEASEGEFDDRIDPHFAVFVAAHVDGVQSGPLTPMSLDVHLTGLRAAGRTLSALLDLRGAAASEWESRLVAVFGHRIYLGASAIAAATPPLPARGTDSGLFPLGRPKQGRALRTVASAAVVKARILRAARSFPRDVQAYTATAESESLGLAALAALHDAALDSRIRLMRSRIHEGWLLSAMSVMFAEVAPAQLKTGAGARVDDLTPGRRIRAEITSLASVIRAHPYVRTAVDTGDVDAARTAAPMFGTVFDRALMRIGHRGPGQVELATTVLGDRPEVVLAAAARAVDRPAGADQPEPTPTGARLYRDLAHDATMRFTHQLRWAVRELARRQVAEEKLAAVDDIFYLTTEEALVMPVDARLRVKRRIAERDRLQAVRLPAVIEGAWTPIADPEAALVDDELRGSGVRPGTAEGKIRLVRSVVDAELRPDDIAVVGAADVDCVPLLGTPGAVVTDRGATTSDPALVAGRIDAPCVVGVAGASTRLVSGMRARVDGTAGTITVLPAGR